jgi:two-component system, cell cycle response regulator DivK
MSSCRAPRVLLVDESVDEREMYAEYFRTRGFCTLQANNATDGYRLAAELRPAIVITDVRLNGGGEDGVAFARRLKRDKDTCYTVVVVLSASTFARDEREAIAAGCDRFMTKPCPPETLASAVQALLANNNTITSAS